MNYRFKISASGMSKNLSQKLEPKTRAKHLSQKLEMFGSFCRRERCKNVAFQLEYFTLPYVVLYVRGTVSRDYNCLKVVWLDRPRLVHATPDIQKILKSPINYI